ncbi:hypothetical protein KAFR_0A04270 [Kazachstania africana CBS 2517]|uniref:Thioredoxin domain-containing protein n=1 Tax=Kazachstania africana (strain ATCC 22294 / BCRC 22015 / CBS 2517 / CECT 1963 / NBRC 1671 / NRRL Y-8276) TaxID=1071382 RepID=H2ANB2_KAZAF|nr:hypothetical protein KAFR_0A04270 [Kazachstania africana CBS 2517]CCF55862.1 hypothetical protein KAFR_0A04270 [Kazachstania africana CBS 2517]
MRSVRNIYILFWISLITSVLAQNFYDSDPHIIELTTKNFDQVIHNTNYTSLVEFYAPWCGYCKKLKPTMHKVAKKLGGTIQVATVNCDLQKNKQLCSQHQIQGFPTLMIFTPPKLSLQKKMKESGESTKHFNEPYNGERSLSYITDFALSRMKTYVKKLVHMDKLKAVLDKSSKTKRFSVLLFSKNDKITPMFKSMAIDWLDKCDFYQFHNKKLSKLTSGNELFISYPHISTSLNDLLESQSKSSKSKLVILDGLQDEIYVFEGQQINKVEVANFISDTLDILPREGPLSKRHNFLKILQSGKKSKPSKSHKKSQSKHDEL